MYIIALVGIPVASFLCYRNIYDIFFIADDFLWLERARYVIPKVPLDIFRSEGLYFDPLIYLSFRLNYILNGIDPGLYHLTDIVIHTLNALLVSCVTFTLSKDKTAAFLSGLIFAVSPTNADAVIWPSCRVDTLAAFFYLSSILSYILFLSKRRVGLYCFSLTLFAVSLSAKSTPVILPLVILSLEIATNNKTDYKSVLFRLTPYFIISGIYLMLLFYNSINAVTQTFYVADGLNTEGILRGISVLFFPESLIAQREGFYEGLSILLLISVTIFGFFISAKSAITGFAIIATILLPLLFMPSTYVFATSQSQTNYLLASICHRLYIAVVGSSILIGVVISFIFTKVERLGKPIHAVIVGLLVVTIFIYGYTSIKKRELLWRTQGEQYKAYVMVVKGMKTYSENLSNLSNLYVINSLFTSFTQSIFRLYLDNCRLNVMHLQESSPIPAAKSSYQIKNGVLIFKREDRHYYLSYYELRSYRE